jgi:hypothetical protein
MKLLKLTNVSPGYKSGAPFVVNLDNITNFVTANNFGIRIYATTSTKNEIGDDINTGFISVDSNTATNADVEQLLAEIQDAITAAPGGRVITLHTTLELISFNFSA